jgi:hypothetical protein
VEDAVKRGIIVAVCLLGLGITSRAEAFCGFYVSGADAKLFNNATHVVLMRDGTRTVLSMQNNYQGPAQDFAMVVPVPQVLQKENVKTLPSSVFGRIDQLSAPRLVEYWEQDPCYKPPRDRYRSRKMSVKRKSRSSARPKPAKPPTVIIEAQFTVGEYDIVVLSATESADLYVWLKQNGYKIPGGAEKVLRPYVASSMKFFVAKVNIKKVKYDASGKTMLSPLRFHYDSKDFSLPIRLGLLNSGGAQDLIVNILAPNQRYEVANYKNVAIPTNLRVRKRTKKDFGRFYASLFDTVMRRNPKAVVTEYAWQASKCDPCPGGGFRGLSGGDLATLGADVLKGARPVPQPAVDPFLPQQPSSKKRRRPRPRPPRWRGPSFVLTRLHTRYTKASLGEDLVFKKASPIVGGRGSYTGRRLPHGVEKSSFNAFQGRYYILNRWKGPVQCQKPRYGRWGGPPSGHRMTPATGIALLKNRKVKLGSFLAQSVPAVGYRYR